MRSVPYFLSFLKSPASIKAVSCKMVATITAHNRTSLFAPCITIVFYVRSACIGSWMKICRFFVSDRISGTLYAGVTSCASASADGQWDRWSQSIRLLWRQKRCVLAAAAAAWPYLIMTATNPSALISKMAFIIHATSRFLPHRQ